jgi:transposase
MPGRVSPVASGASRSSATTDREATGEVRSALEWAEVKALAADGVSTSEIARRLGINWRTAARLVAASEPPSYARAPAGSMLDPLEPVIQALMKECPDITAQRVNETLRR